MTLMLPTGHPLLPTFFDFLIAAVERADAREAAEAANKEAEATHQIAPAGGTHPTPRPQSKRKGEPMPLYQAGANL